MSDQTRTAENEVWYRRPGKRRPARVVWDDHRGTPDTKSEKLGSEGVQIAAVGVAVKATPPDTGDQRPGEGHGEGTARRRRAE